MRATTSQKRLIIKPKNIELNFDQNPFQTTYKFDFNDPKN